MSVLTNIFNKDGALAKGLGAAASGAGKLLSGASEKLSNAFKDICPGTTFQLGNYRTKDGKTADPSGFKVCQEKNFIGKNGDPFYVDSAGVKHMIEKDYFSKFGWSGRKQKKSSRKHKKASNSRKHKKASHSRKHKKATMERKPKKASKKRSMKKSW